MPYVSGVEVQKRFSRWRPSWISHLNNFSLFFIYKSLRFFYWSFESISLSVKEKKLEIDFQDGSRGGHAGFLIRTILAFFFSTSPPNTSYQGSSQLAFQLTRSISQYIFKITAVQQSRISSQNDFRFFFFFFLNLQVALICHTKFPLNCPFHSGEVQNRFSRWRQAALLDFRLEAF